MTINFEKLAEPFPASDIEWRAGATNKDKTSALALAYVTSRAVMDRLDEVCRPANWKNEYKTGPDGGVICGLSIRIGDEWVTKWDGADNSNIEAVKGGLSGAMKRAGVQWGIGRYLYKLDGQWCNCQSYGKSVRLTETPKLPAWALPPNDKSGNKPNKQGKPSNNIIVSGEQKSTKPLRLTPDKLKAALESKAKNYKGSNPPQTTKGVVVANLEKCFAGAGKPADNRHEFLNWLTGHASIKDVDGAMILALKDWLSATQDSGGDWMPCDDAIREARAAVEQYERDNGQKSILGELGVE